MASSSPKAPAFLFAIAGLIFLVSAMFPWIAGDSLNLLFVVPGVMMLATAVVFFLRPPQAATRTDAPNSAGDVTAATSHDGSDEDRSGGD